jgi:putative endonuclease
MFYIYVLKSLKNNKRYIGYTSKDVFIRLDEHNHSSNKWTKQNKPFKLIYSESFNTKIEAIKREKFLKSGKGREYLDTILN